MSKEFTIKNSVHPEYENLYSDWEKFRYVWEGGTNFREQYLRSYSAREDATDFDTRKEITPIPGFATAAITDVKNAIFQRMSDITRKSDSQLYQDIIAGKLGGVDLLSATMDYFVGNEILPELLFMGKVGVYADMPVIEKKQTLNQTRNTHPYFYTYKAEDIRNWRLSQRGEFVEFDMLLLRERILTYDDVYFLPDKDSVRYRLLIRENDVITVRFFDEEDVQIDINGELTNEVIELGIKRIPFTVFELNKSLLQSIADHQIALLNLESSDIGYTLQSNFPFYIEQQSRMTSGHLKNEESENGEDNEIEVGGTMGRSYAQGLHAPTFINPSSEPLLASMKKQQQLKEDIRTLTQLALSAIQPKYASAQAKEFDEHGLESGLSFIGLILEHGERQLASFFNEYENLKDTTVISYPDRYSLKSDSERLNEAEQIYSIMLKISSKTAQRTLSKVIITKLFETKISQEQLNIIFEEIDQAAYITSEPEIIHNDLEKGLVSAETASEARGYNAKIEVPKATQEHGDRIKRIKDAQTSKGEKQLSQDADFQDNSAKAVRGKNKEKGKK